MKMRSLCVLALGTLFTLSAQATTVLYKSFDDLVVESEYVVGGVVAKQDVKKHKDGEIYTTITLKKAYVVDENGPKESNRPINVRFKGGVLVAKDAKGNEVGIEGLQMEGSPEFELGEQVILFLDKNGIADMPIIGWGQGVFRVDDNDDVRDAGHAPLVGIDRGHVMIQTPEGKVSNLAGGSFDSRPTGAAAPQLIDTDGGKDTVISRSSNEQDGDLAEQKAQKSLPALKRPEFVELISDRKYALSKAHRVDPTLEEARLYALPDVSENANKSVTFGNATAQSKGSDSSDEKIVEPKKAPQPKPSAQD